MVEVMTPCLTCRHSRFQHESRTGKPPEPCLTCSCEDYQARPGDPDAAVAAIPMDEWPDRRDPDAIADAYEMLHDLNERYDGR